MSDSKAGSVISSVDGLPMRPSGPWIARKHFFLDRYCGILSKGMKKQWNLVYIDLFAGPGRCLVELDPPHESVGSPLIALGYNFDRYIFVEQNEEDFKALCTRCGHSPKNKNILFVQRDCNNVAEIINSHLSTNDLCFAFIDPTGIDIHFDSIKKLTANGRKVDLLINIMFGMDIKRNFERYYRRDGSDLDLFLGGNVDWNEIKTPTDALNLYKKRIGDLGYKTVRF